MCCATPAIPEIWTWLRRCDPARGSSGQCERGHLKDRVRTLLADDEAIDVAGYRSRLPRWRLRRTLGKRPEEFLVGEANASGRRTSSRALAVGWNRVAGLLRRTRQFASDEFAEVVGDAPALPHGQGPELDPVDVSDVDASGVLIVTHVSISLVAGVVNAVRSTSTR